MNKPKAIFNWSGGKDSSLALYKVIEEGAFDIPWLLTSVNETNNRISMHGVRGELLDEQARSIGIPLHKMLIPEMASMEIYNKIVADTIRGFKKEGIEYSIFGDIFLEDLKKYREEQLEKVNMKAIFPIWKQPTNLLINEFIDLGFKAVIVCVNDKYLDRSFAGRVIDRAFVNDLPGNVDPCGENGEYHSFVFDGPIFTSPIEFSLGEVVYKKYDTGDHSG
ncbi:MAG: ATP-binding protein, partial [Bacteroidota bacterium]|nr:ATP-binding protein [Bacteroidota bacterium]